MDKVTAQWSRRLCIPVNRAYHVRTDNVDVFVELDESFVSVAAVFSTLSVMTSVESVD